jgi:beta-N-acetylhexosaminidase
VTAPPLAAIVGLAGARLREDERTLFSELKPAGFILFARNIETPAQLRALTEELAALFPDRRAPILVDQEGGRVMRLRPPLWPDLPAAARIGRLAAIDPASAREAARRLGEVIGRELRAVGISVDCAPCLDVAEPGTTSAIGDRAFADDPELVGDLGGALIDGLRAAGVLPVIKHLPGHGRARVDSHHALPVVDAGLDELERRDLVPFRRCRHAPLAMTAHVVYAAIDPDHPATHSARVIAELIRGAIGFAGILLSDDLGMNALAGAIGERAARAVAAGCDLALHCSGRLEETRAVLAAVPRLPERTLATLDSLLADAAALGSGPLPLEPALARLDSLLAIA